MLLKKKSFPIVVEEGEGVEEEEGVVQGERGGGDVLAGSLRGFPAVDAGDGGGAAGADGREVQLECSSRASSMLSCAESKEHSQVHSWSLR